MRRRRRTWSPQIERWERRWALGELDSADPGYAEIFFETAERMRAVWAAVHGESFGAWLLRHPERWHPGKLLVHGAVVADVTPEHLAALEAGTDPWLADG